MTDTLRVVADQIELYGQPVARLLLKLSLSLVDRLKELFADIDEDDDQALYCSFRGAGRGAGRADRWSRDAAGEGAAQGESAMSEVERHIQLLSQLHEARIADDPRIPDALRESLD
jgi:hypothetical protein